MNYFRLSYRRWLAWLALAAVFSVACWFLSQWQFARRAEVVAVINQLNANYDRTPISLAAADAASPSKIKWMPVTLAGKYDSAGALLVRNRAMNGNPGFEQLVPFVTDFGQRVFIDRGWLPTGDKQDLPDKNPLPTGDAYQVTGHLMPSEARDGRSAPPGQLATVDLYQAAQRLHFKPATIVRNFYLTLSNETPQAKLAPVKIDRPQLDEGNHLSYAFQWLAFIVLAFAALVWAIRKEFDEYRLVNDPNFKPRPKRVTRADVDEQTEDAALGE